MILNYFFKNIGKIFFSLLILTGFTMANEQPDYTVIKKENEFEIRQYSNFLTATVEAEGERDEAIGSSLSRITLACRPIEFKSSISSF